MRPSFWQLAFRPFFLFGSAFAVVTIGLWILYLAGEVPALGTLPPMLWHPHEMVYGFAAAIIGGFVLTAAQNWSGIRGVHGAPLVFLVTLWAVARLLFALPAAAPTLVAVIDLAFFPVCSFLVHPYLKDAELKTEKRVFHLLFLLLFTGNALVHLDHVGAPAWLDGQARRGLFLGLNTVLLMIVFMGGRVIPFFTESSTARAQPRTWKTVEALSHVSTVAYLVADFFISMTALFATIAFFAALVHLVRLSGWQVRRVRRIPLLWVLHIGYLWLVIGFTLAGLAGLGIVAYSTAVHAFTVGGFGIIVYGMITRVGLGHTGRRLHPSLWVVVGYVFLVLSAVFRVFLPITAPSVYLPALVASAVCWIVAFLLFLIVYFPILSTPRVDGRPG